MNMETLSIIVSSYNQLVTLKLAMESYSVQSMMPLEVIVADDGSDDGTREWVESNPFGLRAQFVSGDHDGYGLVSSFNRAALRAKGSRLLFTNADIIHCPESCKAHCRVDPDVAGVGVLAGLRNPDPVSLTGVVGDVARIEAFRYASIWDNGDFKDININQNHVAACSGNLSVSAEAFRAVNGFDEDYAGKWGCEDYDLLDRLGAIGIPMDWAKDSVGYHFDHPLAGYAKERLGCKLYFERKDDSSQHKEDGPVGDLSLPHL